MGRRRFADSELELRVIDSHVGTRMRLRRGLLGLTQAELGKRLGLTYQQVQKYECGKNSMSAGRLWQMARALDVPITFLFDALPATVDALVPVPDAAAAPPALEGRDTLELVTRFHRIPDPRLRRRVLEFLSALARLPPAPEPAGPEPAP